MLCMELDMKNRMNSTNTNYEESCHGRPMLKFCHVLYEETAMEKYRMSTRNKNYEQKKLHGRFILKFAMLFKFKFPCVV